MIEIDNNLVGMFLRDGIQISRVRHIQQPSVICFLIVYSKNFQQCFYPFIIIASRIEVNPLSIILVKSDSKCDHLLFRYPFYYTEKNEPFSTKRRNPYTLLPNLEDLLQSPSQPISNISKGQLTGFTDEVLSSIFAVQSKLCNKKFELKVNDVRFVSHPTLLQLRDKQQDASGLMLINVVFALQALASHSNGKYKIKRVFSIRVLSFSYLLS